MRADRKQLLCVAALLAAVVGAYGNALGAIFQFDDYNVIVDNPNVASLAAWWSGMPGIRPLLKLSYALAGGGASALVQHALNVALHALDTVFVYLLLVRLLPATAPGIAFAVALVFAVHPVNTEAVTMVSGRSVSLMAAFYLGSLLAWTAPTPRRGLSLALFAAALASKEIAITLPAAMLLIDRRRFPAAGWRLWLLPARWHWLLAATCVGVLLMTPGGRMLLTGGFEVRGAVENLVTQSAAILYLASRLVFFTALDADPQLPEFGGWDMFWAMTVAIHAFAALAAGLAWRRAPAVGLALLWFYLHLAPTNSIIPRLDVANERQLYLAALGPYLLVAAATARLIGAARAPAWSAAPVLVAAALVLAGATRERNGIYRDEITFWSEAVRSSPDNARARNNLGYAYALAGQPDRARAEYLRAIAIDPDGYRARLNLRALGAATAQPAR